MNHEQILSSIMALSRVIEVNKGWLGSERIIRDANEKIKELIKMI